MKAGIRESGLRLGTNLTSALVAGLHPDPGRDEPVKIGMDMKTVARIYFRFPDSLLNGLCA